LLILHYKIYRDTKKKSEHFGEYYARVVVNHTIDLTELAEHMSNHNTPFSKGAIYGVLTDMVACIRELVLEGNAVKIPDLAIFSIGIETRPVRTAEDFTPSKNIRSAYLRSGTTGKFMRSQVSKAVRVQEQSIYALPEKKSDGEGETKPGGETGGGDTTKP